MRKRVLVKKGLREGRQQAVLDSSGEQRGTEQGERRSQYEKVRIYKAYFVSRFFKIEG